jgi:hypothetical protein
METSMRDPQLWETFLETPVEVGSGPGNLRAEIKNACRLNDREYDHVVHEYRKFIYLLAVTNERLRPSEIVDLIWKIHARNPAHLLQKRRPLPDWPPRYVERSRLRSWDPEYALTLKHYQEKFGRKGPMLIWPSVLLSRFLVIVGVLICASIPAMAFGLEKGGL